MTCPDCGIALTYHRSSNAAVCHYCGRKFPLRDTCPDCGSRFIKYAGAGTEKVEDEVRSLWPDAGVDRFDLDTASAADDPTKVIDDFQKGKTDILVGTQMVTKGLDFDNVSVVGILSADNLISFPDFRAYERSFQQMTQVSGRAGRRGKQGKVIIQSYQPYHQAIRDAMANDYESMYKSQIVERRVFKYPPYYKLIVITVRHQKEDLVNQVAALYAARLREQFGTRVMGPEYPNVARIRNQYLKRIMVRFAVGEAIGEGKRIMLSLADEVLKDKTLARVQILFDVDPQ